LAPLVGQVKAKARNVKVLPPSVETLSAEDV
jgi:hypothetical protein